MKSLTRKCGPGVRISTFDARDGNTLGDVGRPLERVVVDANQLVVAGDAEILLDEVDVRARWRAGAAAVCFGRRPRCAAMRDRLLPAAALRVPCGDDEHDDERGDERA